MISANSYGRRTGQSWKVYLFLILLLASGVFLLVGFTTARDQPSRFVPFVLGGTFIGAIAIVVVLVSPM